MRCRRKEITFSGFTIHGAAALEVDVLCREEEKRQKAAERDQNREARGDFKSATCNWISFLAVRQSSWAVSCANASMRILFGTARRVSR